MEFVQNLPPWGVALLFWQYRFLSLQVVCQFFEEVIMDTENLEPTVEYTDEETGELVIKELAKEYLSKGESGFEISIFHYTNVQLHVIFNFTTLKFVSLP